MRKNPYHRYALMDNPFKPEERGDISLLHVKQDIDDVIDDFFFDTIERNLKALLQIVGGKGSGKTEHLLLLEARAKEEDAFCSYINAKEKDAFSVIAEILNEVSRSKSKRKMFIVKPGWLKELEEAKRNFKKKKTIDVGGLSDVISGALVECSPSFLLLDDLDIDLGVEVDTERLLMLLKEVFDKANTGVLIVITSEKEMDWVTKKVELKGFEDREAELFVAKRLLSKRTIGEKLDPLFPFTPDAVHQVNELVNGNPKEFKEKMANILDLSVARRVRLIDKDFVVRALLREE
jgi:hypothetical protein